MAPAPQPTNPVGYPPPLTKTGQHRLWSQCDSGLTPAAITWWPCSKHMSPSGPPFLRIYKMWAAKNRNISRIDSENSYNMGGPSTSIHWVPPCTRHISGTRNTRKKKPPPTPTRAAPGPLAEKQGPLTFREHSAQCLGTKKSTRQTWILFPSSG